MIQCELYSGKEYVTGILEEVDSDDDDDDDDDESNNGEVNANAENGGDDVVQVQHDEHGADADAENGDHGE